MNPKLYIVIAVHNRVNVTLKCLEQLNRQHWKNFKVVVVDDGSTDGTSEKIVQQYPQTLLLKGTGDWWWTKSVNAGIQHALDNGATHVLLLNDDTIFNDDYLDILLSDIRANPDAVIGSLNLTLETPHKVYFSGTSGFDPLTFKHYRYHKTMAAYDPEEFKGTRESRYLPARGMLVPASAFRKIGLLDEVNFPQYFSDVDFSMKAVRAGIRCIISYNAILYTPVNSTGAGDFYKKEPARKFFRSFSNPYSKRHLGTSYRFVRNHSYKLLAPVSYLFYQGRILGTFVKSRLS